MSEQRIFMHKTGRAIEKASKGFLLGLTFVLIGGVLVALPYSIIRASSEYLPPGLHAVVVGAAALLLGAGIYTISTKELRKKWFPWIFWMFGPVGPPVYCALVLVSAAAVMASFTFLLFDSGLVEMSSDLKGGVTEGRLVDFYMWHFFELIPFLSINETANLAEPATYSGTWVGILVLIFQGLVVLPIIATIRYYLSDEGKEVGRKEREWRHG